MALCKSHHGKQKEKRDTARAMSQENLEIVSRAISAINERDVDAYMAVCNPDFELINPVAAIEGSNRGDEGIRAFFEGIREATLRFELEVERLQPLDGNRVLASLTLRVETRGGFEQGQAITNLYELKDGKLSRVRVFWDHAQALETAGLSE
jgi:ketosteroid isomerase-like protein